MLNRVCEVGSFIILTNFKNAFIKSLYFFIFAESSEEGQVAQNQLLEKRKEEESANGTTKLGGSLTFL